MSVPESVRLSVGDVLVSSEPPRLTVMVVEVREDGSVELRYRSVTFCLSRAALAHKSCEWTQPKGVKQ